MSNKDDCISRQAAIDTLKDARHRFSVADEAGGIGTVKWSEDVIYFAAAKRALADLPSVQPDHVADVSKKVGWIPCSERLPEKMGYYLISNEYKVVHEDYYWGSGCFEKAKKYQCEVVAWMPMPIPPYCGV